MPYLTKSFRFSAAHRYAVKEWGEARNFETFGDDVRLHGHDYVLEVTVRGKVDPLTGFVADLKALKDVVGRSVIDHLDHAVIEQEIPWFKTRQPSSENLAVWIWNQLEEKVGRGRLFRIRVRETPTIYADYYGEGELEGSAPKEGGRCP